MVAILHEIFADINRRRLAAATASPRLRGRFADTLTVGNRHVISEQAQLATSPF